VETLLLNGFKSAFLPQLLKAELIRETAVRFLELRDTFALDDLERI
jgi:hypothetical protein